MRRHLTAESIIHAMEAGDFYATVEFTYRLMKKLGTAPSL